MATAKKIQVRRKEKQNYLPTEVKANAQRVIGSVFKNRRPLGIENDDLEEELLQDYADIRPDDRDYADKKNDFWKEMRVIVPHDGKVLNISKNEDGDPIETEDFLIYKWLENHPLVAGSREEMNSNSNKEFYLYDPDEEIHNEHKQAEKRKQAYKALIKIDDNEEVKDQLIRLLDDSNPDKLTDVMKDNKLEEIASTQPKRFLKYAEDKNLAIRAEIEEMVEYGVLRKSGNQYIYMDEVVGDTMDDAIVFFKNERNSQTVLDLRAKLEEAKKIG